MAFSLQNLAPLGNNARPCTDLTAGALGRGAPRMWSYITEDAAAAVDSAGYFNGAYNNLEIGDLIYRVTLSTGALSSMGFHVVKDKASGTIDVTDAQAITITDTD